MTITQGELNEELELHYKWLMGESDGVKLELSSMDLNRAELRGADLRDADLKGANLRDADLNGANLDYSVLPLWCGKLPRCGTLSGDGKE